jgi:hypothetical protein
MTTVVSFRSGGQDWAVPLDRVQRVVGGRGLLPLPDPRPGVTGLLHRDGHTVTVVSPLGGGQPGQVLVLDGDGGGTSIGSPRTPWSSGPSWSSSSSPAATG